MAAIRAGLLVLGLVLLVMPAEAGPAGGERLSSEEQRFLSKYTQLKNERMHSLHWFRRDLSPWLPYLKQPFEDGLSERDKKRYLDAQNVHRCYEVSDLDVKGFLNLYPQLGRLFTDLSIRYDFIIDVASELSRGKRRCAALQHLDRDFLVRARGVDVEIEGEDWSKNERLALPAAAYPWPNSDNPLHQLKLVAFCGDYRPAIADLLQFDRAYEDVLTSTERAYLRTRAFHHEIKPYRTADAVSATTKFLPAHMRSNWSAFSYPIDPWEFGQVLPRWYELCRTTRFLHIFEE